MKRGEGLGERGGGGETNKECCFCVNVWVVMNAIRPYKDLSASYTTLPKEVYSPTSLYSTCVVH